jgi:hypothetical protein
LNIVSVYSGSDGESHFRDVDLREDRTGASVQYAHPILDGVTRHYLPTGRGIRDVYIRENQNANDREWHKARYPHYLVVLKGEVEVEVADGSKRRWGEGEILLVEDTTGHGHMNLKSNLTSLILVLK